MDLTTYNLEANLRYLYEDAPETMCGRCYAAMDVAAIHVRSWIDIDWLTKPIDAADRFTPAMPLTRYDGDIEYHCPQCDVHLFHRQRVSLLDDGFHFDAPNEEHN